MAESRQKEGESYMPLPQLLAAAAVLSFYDHHSVVAELITELRNVDTDYPKWAQAAHRLTFLLGSLACSDLSTKPILVTTPLESTTGKRVDEDIAVVPILRAGMCCVPAMRELLPRARIYPLGMASDELTTLPSFYSCKLSGQAVDTAILTDPMLATGGSAVAAIGKLREWGVPRIKLLCFFASPEGLEHVQAQDPAVQIYTGVIDRCLNERKYILPGCGDAGQRWTGAGH
jgi:uracil phosphoribosyltransferase